MSSDEAFVHECTVAERIARQGLYAPSGMTLTGEEVDRVCAAVGEVLADVPTFSRSSVRTF